MFAPFLLLMTTTFCDPTGQVCVTVDNKCVDIDTPTIQASACIDGSLSWCSGAECSEESNSTDVQEMLFDITTDPSAACNTGKYTSPASGSTTDYFQCCRPTSSTEHKCCGVATTHSGPNKGVEAFCLTSPCGSGTNQPTCGQGV